MQWTKPTRPASGQRRPRRPALGVEHLAHGHGVKTREGRGPTWRGQGDGAPWYRHVRFLHPPRLPSFTAVLVNLEGTYALATGCLAPVLVGLGRLSLVSATPKRDVMDRTGQDTHPSILPPPRLSPSSFQRWSLSASPTVAAEGPSSVLSRASSPLNSSPTTTAKSRIRAQLSSPSPRPNLESD
jgi:hypothetical protein